MIGKVIGLGKVKRKVLTVDAPTYKFDERFEAVMSWIDENIEVISLTPIKREMDDYDYLTEEYLVIYRSLERE